MGVLYNEKYEPWMDGKALELFADGESITSVCCDLDIDRGTYYEWSKDKEHPFYKIARKGEKLSQQYWERLGRQGIRGDLDKFAGSSWQFVLKNRFREHYSDEKKPVDEGQTLVEQLAAAIAAQAKK